MWGKQENSNIIHIFMPTMDDTLKRLNPYVGYPAFTGQSGEAEGGLRGGRLFDKLPSPERGSWRTEESFLFSGQPERSIQLRNQLSDEITQPSRHIMEIVSNFARTRARGGAVRATLENLTTDEVRRIKKVLENSPELFDTLVDVPFNISTKDNVKHYDFIEYPQSRLESWVRKLWEAQSKVKLDKSDKGPLYAKRYFREQAADKLRVLLKVRKFMNLGLLTAGAGAAGSLLDDKDRMLSAGLSTAAGSAALPTLLATLGGKKLNRLITRKPLAGLAAGALGGLGGFFGNNTIQDFLQKIR